VRTASQIGIVPLYSGKQELYDVLHEFPFDSSRKRMSTVLRKEGTNSIVLLTKGADNIMMPRMAASKGLLEATNKDLYEFACKGLRTLVMGWRIINIGEYTKWVERFNKANTSHSADKEEQLLALYDELEQGLEYVGSSAIEDLL